MGTIADTLQAWLTGPDYKSDVLRQQLASVATPTPIDLAHVRLALRTSVAIEGAGRGETSPLDLAVLLRQLIRVFGQRFQVRASIWRQIEPLDRRAGLSAVKEGENLVEISARAWGPDWLAGTEQIDILQTRRIPDLAPGNGQLLKAYGHYTYQSEAQKVAVEACQFAAAGSTTLITLPTGGGKSLCAVLPAWIRTLGGTRRGGTTIVVVPTVALALDQYASAKRYFREAHPQYQPYCWNGQTSLEERETIREGVENGTIPLLFTSPESLILSSLKRAVLTSAMRDNIAHFVIDEAHIIESWGAQFRAEFQLLAAFLRELYAASQGQLRTSLLSATVDQHSEELLEQLFGVGSYTVVRANGIRPEPSWWFSWSHSAAGRERRVVEALYYLPRPAILYVTSPEDANTWASRLREVGYKRVESFSGRTGGAARDTLLKRWRDDDVDIMVATSAFGLGVDKSDVRAMIHACLPETIDRFYQEVGRGGRDGNSCISLVCAVEQDLDTAIGLTSASHITTEKAVSRWFGMYRTRRMQDDSNSLLSINVDAPPLHNLDMDQGHRNREWNMHTLLLLQRARLLHIEQSTSASIDDSGSDIQAPEHRISVRMVDLQALQGTSEQLASRLSFVREAERRRVVERARAMKHLAIENTAQESMPECVAMTFARLYPDCALACGGCPACRQVGKLPYAEKLGFFVDRLEGTDDSPAPLIDGDLSTLMGMRARLLIQRPDARMSGLTQLLVALVGSGVVQLVLANELIDESAWIGNLVGCLAEHSEIPHLIIPERWVGERADVPLRNLPTAVVYPGSDSETDRLFQAFQRRWENQPRSTPVLHIIPEGIYLPSESGRFVNRVPGLLVSSEAIVNQSQTTQEEWF